MMRVVLAKSSIHAKWWRKLRWDMVDVCRRCSCLILALVLEYGRVSVEWERRGQTASRSLCERMLGGFAMRNTAIRVWAFQGSCWFWRGYAGLLLNHFYLNRLNCGRLWRAPGIENGRLESAGHWLTSEEKRDMQAIDLGVWLPCYSGGQDPELSPHLVICHRIESKCLSLYPVGFGL